MGFQTVTSNVLSPKSTWGSQNYDMHKFYLEFAADIIILKQDSLPYNKIAII